MVTSMIEVKTADLIGPALDWVVAKVEGHDAHHSGGVVRTTMHGVFGPELRYSTDWSQGGPLIEKYRTSIIYSDEVCNPCAWTDDTAAWHATTPLIAACRAIVAAKLGETVRCPKELMPTSAGL